MNILKKMFKNRLDIRISVSIVFKVLIIIATVELLIMVFFLMFDNNFTNVQMIFIDAFLLSIVSATLLYIYVISPYIKKEAISRKELRRLNEIFTTNVIASRTDLSGVITYASEALCHISGYTEKELIGKPHNILRHPDTSASAFKDLWETIQSGSKWKGVLKNKKKDGGYYWVTASVLPEFDDDNNIIGYSSIRHDITLKTEAYEKLDKQAEVLSKLTENIPGAVYQYQLHPDGHSNFPYSSKGIKVIYEVEPKNIVDDAQLVFDVIHPDDLNMITTTIQHSAETLNDWNVQYRVILPKRGVRWLEGFSKPEKLTDGSILWHGYINDITDRKNAENILNEQKNILDYQHQLLDDILNTTDTPMFLTDFKDVKLSNSKFKELLNANTIKLINEKENHNILDIFEHSNGYLHEGLLQEKESFFSLFKRSEVKDKIVMILDRDINPIAFQISIIKTKQNNDYLITLSDITQMKELQIETAHKAYIDGLTQVYNRNKFDEVFKNELREIRRYPKPLTIAIIDIDKFKTFNDTYGHLIGDEVLIQMAQTVKVHVRETDTFARWGGEEFIILFKETTVEDAKLVSEKIKDKIQDNFHPIAGQITASFGITEYIEGDTIETIFKRCDDALYVAKENGRNRVEIL